jgi:hypothetical protein
MEKKSALFYKGQEIAVSINAVDAHLDYGDLIFRC